MQLISPRNFVRLSHEEWTKNFDSCSKAIEGGTIFLIYGNAALTEIYEKFIRPRYESRKYSYFGPNPPDLHRSQAIQKALFLSVKSKTPLFVDAYVRLRHTKGKGAFVGPHIDCYEDLPQNSLNCWVSFSHLEAGEAIQFLPAHHYMSGENLSGHFKSGVYLDKSNRLLPTKSVQNDARSYKIGPCEYFVFNSGRTVHCSPFFVKRDRVTCDQRIFMQTSDEDANFGELMNYYALSDIDRFDKSMGAEIVLKDLWGIYADRYDFPICQFLSKTSASTSSQLDIAEEVGLDFGLFFRQKIRQPLELDHQLIRTWLSQNSKCVSLRLRILDSAPITDQSFSLCDELMSLPPENPTKMYGKILAFIFTQSSPNQFNENIKHGYSTNSRNVLRLLNWLKAGSGRALPAPIKARLNKYFSFMLLRKLHPQVTHGY